MQFNCYVTAVQLQCNATAMQLQCNCNATAMQLQRNGYFFEKRLREEEEEEKATARACRTGPEAKNCHQFSQEI